MPLSPGRRDLVRDAFAQMTASVTLHCIAGPGEASAEAWRLARELAVLAGRLQLEYHDLRAHPEAAARFRVASVPTFVVAGDRDRGIRLCGAPAGYEFMTLVDSILMVSTGDSGLSVVSRAQLATLAEPVDILVFVTPTCASCPPMVSLAHRMAFESDLVTATAVMATDFPDLVRRYRVTGVPKTIVNESIEILGAVSEEEVVGRVVEGIRS